MKATNDPLCKQTMMSELCQGLEACSAWCLNAFKGSQRCSPDDTRAQEAAMTTWQLVQGNVGMARHIGSPLTLQCCHLHQPTRCHQTATKCRSQSSFGVGWTLPSAIHRGPNSRCSTTTSNHASNGRLTGHQAHQIAEGGGIDKHWLCHCFLWGLQTAAKLGVA